MHYINEQITKTFEHLHDKYHSIDTLISSPRKSRILYRINQEKLDKYRSQYNKTQLLSNENKILPIEGRKTISTQTTFNKEMDSSTDLIHSSVNMSSELDISVSSSLSNTNPTTTKNFNSSSPELSIEFDSNQIQDYKFHSQPQSTTCRVYIRSIVRHMLSDDTSDEN